VKKWITITGVFLLLFQIGSINGAFSANKVQVKVGGSCPTVNQYSLAGNISVLCTKVNKKLIWVIQRSQPAAPMITLRYGTDIHGSVVGEPLQKITPGATGTRVTAIPLSGYEFVSWSDGNTEPTRIDSPTQDKDFVATFKRVTYTIGYIADVHGTLSGEHTQSLGMGNTTSPITVKPDEGYEFDSWSDGNTELTRSDIATSNQVFTAKFKAKNYAPKIDGHLIGSLLWSDEFNSTVPTPIDSKSWTARNCGSATTNGGSTCMTGEVQYYAPSAISLDGSGSAVITATHTYQLPLDAGACGSWSRTCPFVSGRFDTQGKVSFQYGYIEAKIKMPKGGGNWPAFWMLGENITSVGWPSSGEIDIVEAGGDRPTLVHGSLNFRSAGGQPTFVTGIDVASDDLSSDFHTYGVLWLKDSISFYFDNKLYETQTPSTISGANWSFNAPFFLILNNAIAPAGSYFGGNWDGWNSSSMSIDFVRAWQVDGQGTVVKG